MGLCVLTGDIVGSTNLTRAQQERVQVVLENSFSDLKENNVAVLDTFRGDGWQMAFPIDNPGLRHALYVRACLKADNEKFETRISLAYDPEMHCMPGLNTDIHVASGRALDDMPRGVLMVHAAGGALHAATLLADHVSRDWTVAQANATKPFLLPNSRVTQKYVADRLSISRQAVGQALDAAGYHVIERALRATEEQVK